MLRALAAIVLVAALNALGLPKAEFPYPRPGQMRLAAEDAVLNAALLSLGMRRLAADLSFIHLIIYYGTSEGSKWSEPTHESTEGGSYSELGPRAVRTLELDPYFDYPILYTAGALAFNLNRPDEALTVLRAGLAYQPRNWRYHSYVAAVGFARKGDAPGALKQLEPILREPDCPTLLKHLAAFMYVRLGRKEEAIGMYREILSSRDQNYWETARKALERLGVKPD